MNVAFRCVTLKASVQRAGAVAKHSRGLRLVAGG